MSDEYHKPTTTECEVCKGTGEIPVITYKEEANSIVNNHHFMENKNLTPETKLEDLGIDSLSYVELVMELEEHFNIEIQDEEIDMIKTVGDIHQIVYSRRIET